MEGSERAFHLSFSSEAPYNRWFGPEILDHADDAVDLSRINEIGVLLFNHDRDAVLGKIEKAWIENGRGEADVIFDSDEAAEKIYQKVKSGTLKGVSVGYMVDTWEEVMPGKKSTDGRFTGPCSIARKWAPYEISIVSVPADPGVGVGRDAATYTRQLQYKNLLSKEEKTMSREQMLARMRELLDAAEDRAMTDAEQAEFDRLKRSVELLDLSAPQADGGHRDLSRADGEDGKDDGGDEPDSDEAEEDDKKAEAAAQKALDAERKRVRQIEDLCRDFGVDSRDYVDKGHSVESVRAAVLEKLRASNQPIRTSVSVKDTGAERYVRDVSDALVMRSGAEIENPSEGARKLMGMSLRDIAVECIEMEGGNAKELLRMSRDELYEKLTRDFFNPAALFPAIMDESIKKTIVDEYQKVPTTFQAWTRKGSVSDFKPTPDHNYLLGGVGDFELVPENGELKHSIPKTHLLPQRKIDTYGKQFSMSRQAFINDDIGFLSEVPAAYTRAAKRTIDKAVYSILFDNPAVFDGVTLFHSNHKNVINTGAAPSQQSIQEIILQAQNQTDPFDEPIYEVPKFLIVPMGYEFTLAVIFKSSQVTGSSNNDINPLYNYPLQVVQSPWLNTFAGENAKPWFMVTDPATSKSIQVDYLNGKETPTFRRSEPTGQLGFVWDIWLDWGVSVVDYRGIYKNPGVA